MFDRKIIILCLSVLFIGYACDTDNPNGFVDDFDYAAQSLIDNDSLVDFFETHYYNDAIDSVQPLVSGALALINDSRLLTQDISDREVDYKLYSFVKREGTPDPIKSFPTVMDSILVLLSSKAFEDVYSVQGKFKLKDEITTRVNRFLVVGHVKDAYFTEFIIQ